MLGSHIRMGNLITRKANLVCRKLHLLADMFFSGKLVDLCFKGATTYPVTLCCELDCRTGHHDSSSWSIRPERKMCLVGDARYFFWHIWVFSFVYPSRPHHSII